MKTFSFFIYILHFPGFNNWFLKLLFALFRLFDFTISQFINSAKFLGNITFIRSNWSNNLLVFLSFFPRTSQISRALPDCSPDMLHSYSWHSLCLFQVLNIFFPTCLILLSLHLFTWFKNKYYSYSLWERSSEKNIYFSGITHLTFIHATLILECQITGLEFSIQIILIYKFEDISPLFSSVF